MRSSTLNIGPDPGVDRHWLGVFEDRYGVGALDRLLKILAQPCVTFAQIAEQFGVTRERVRQWHLRLMPEAPRGHARQRLCRNVKRKRRLLADPVFRSFYQNARNHFEPSRFRLVQGRDGFRRRAVHLDQRLIAIKDAHRLRRGPSKPAAYGLPGGGRHAVFIYYRLSERDFLFVPRGVVPDTGTTFLDGGASKYERFKNAFGPALESDHA